MVPPEGFFGGFEEVGVTDGFEQIVECVDAVAFGGVLAEGGGEDDACAVGKYAREFHAAELGHLYVEIEEVDVRVGERGQGVDGAVECADEAEEGCLQDVALEESDGEGFVVDNGTGEGHNIFVLYFGE